ncbi:SRPBCC family protein [Angustibacter aerolatus]
MPELTDRQWLPAPVDEVLRVSLDLDVELAAGARWRVRTLDRGPGWRTSGEIALGERVTWAVRLVGLVPVHHTSEIVRLEHTPAGAVFTDEMVSGAFASFRHEHVLEASRGGTLARDHMTWTSPLGPLGRVADVVFVRRTLRALLRDRNAEVQRRFVAPAGGAPRAAA